MGKTVYFRAFEEEDAEFIYKWMNDDDLLELSVGLNRKICKDEAVDWVKARMLHNPYQVWWAICAIDSSKIIGYMSLTDIHYINSSANFSGIVIGDNDYRDGFAWIESYLFVYEYAFEKLNLNRVYGSYISDHKVTNVMGNLMCGVYEGTLRQAIFKNGRYHDVITGSLLKEEYYQHKRSGDYEMKSMLKRLRELKKQTNIVK